MVKLEIVVDCDPQQFEFTDHFNLDLARAQVFWNDAPFFIHCECFVPVYVQPIKCAPVEEAFNVSVELANRIMDARCFCSQGAAPASNVDVLVHIHKSNKLLFYKRQSWQMCWNFPWIVFRPRKEAL